MDINITPMNIKYKDAVIDICYRTGYLGEDLTNRNIFNDKLLFAYLFSLYYVYYQADNSFVAIDRDSNKVLGYILGAPTNVDNQMKLRFGPIILFRGIIDIITEWKSTGKTMLSFIKHSKQHDDSSYINEYPAHLHINVLPEYQHYGIGKMMLKTMEEHFISNNIIGINLTTTDANVKAINFYHKHNYIELMRYQQRIWPDVITNTIVFGKKLQQE